MKTGFICVTVNDSVPPETLRSTNSTSDGELTRVGTCAVEKVGGPEVRPVSESFGKTLYISTVTWLIPVCRSTLAGKRPINVAESIIVRGQVRTKSSAASVSWFAPLPGPMRVAMPIFPSGAPLLNKLVALAGTISKPAVRIVVTKRSISDSPVTGVRNQSCCSAPRLRAEALNYLE